MSNETPRDLHCAVKFMEYSPILMSKCLSLNLFNLFAVPKSTTSVFPLLRFMISSGKCLVVLSNLPTIEQIVCEPIKLMACNFLGLELGEKTAMTNGVNKS